MRLFSDFNEAADELAENGGWLVQTSIRPMLLWHCDEKSEVIQMLTEAGFSRSHAYAIAEDYEFNENYNISAFGLACDYIKPLQGLQQVGPSSDWCNPAWLLAGDTRGEHTVLYETDDYEYIIIERTYPNGPDEDHHHEESEPCENPRDALEIYREWCK